MKTSIATERQFRSIAAGCSGCTLKSLATVGPICCDAVGLDVIFHKLSTSMGLGLMLVSSDTAVAA